MIGTTRPQTKRTRKRLCRLISVCLFCVIVCVFALCRRFHAAIVRARSIPFSPLTAGWHVGSDYLDRYNIETTGEVAGEVDDFDVFARPDFDPNDVDPAVRRFYERTTDHRLVYDVTWHRGFRIGASLVSPFTSWIEQLNLPGPGETGTQRELQSRIVGLATQADPRQGARAWIRVDPSNREAVFVAMYARHQRDGITYTNIAAPLPGMNLSTVLHVDAMGTHEDGIALTTQTETGDEGLYLVTPLCAISLPMDQRFRVWPADTPDPDAPGEIDTMPNNRPANIVATHEMWVCGRRFLTVDYHGWSEND